MIVAFVLMFTGGLAGIIDQVYYHIYKFKLHKLQIARWEHLTHVGRDLTYLLFFILMSVRATGKWWWLYPVVAAVHFVIVMADVGLEPYTRRTLGGIPGGEYRLHGFIAMMDGLATGFVFWERMRIVISATTSHGRRSSCPRCSGSCRISPWCWRSGSSHTTLATSAGLSICASERSRPPEVGEWALHPA
jgi:hypothetical protein